VPDPGAHPGLDSLIENERRLSQAVSGMLRHAGVAQVDVLEALSQMGPQPYFEDADGHPNAEGHRRIARAVESRLGAGGTPR
jgi:hypothetical protein